MQIKVNETKPAFEPVTLSITIESAEELKALWVYINMAHNEFSANTNNNWAEATENLVDLWKTIDDVCQQKGLR